MENGTKLRILYLYQYLVKHTDPSHTLSTSELIKAMKDTYGIKVSRNTISNDLNMLHESGLHIEHYESTQNKYYYDGNPYDVVEIKILMDAVSSSKFITEHKSEQLIEKMMKLTNDDLADHLRRYIYVEGRAKSDNENGYYILDAINEAIVTKKRIQFKYTDFDVHKKRILTNNGESYTVSPFTVVWDGDYYYLRGYCHERKGMRNFRVDRIDRQPEILNLPAVDPPEDYNPAAYSKAVFRMLDTDKPVAVSLLCHASMMKYLIDEFGGDVETYAIDEAHFTANVMVCPSATFFRWVFGFDGQIQITGPKDVLMEYRQKVERAREMLYD